MKFRQACALVALICSHLLLFSCNKKAPAGSENPGPAKGYIIGKVTDARGTPIQGAKILLDNQILYASYINGTTDKNGHYKIKLPSGGLISGNPMLPLTENIMGENIHWI